jgi:hypothetical protein
MKTLENNLGVKIPGFGLADLAKKQFIRNVEFLSLAAISDK